MLRSCPSVLRRSWPLRDFAFASFLVKLTTSSWLCLSLCSPHLLRVARCWCPRQPDSGASTPRPDARRFGGFHLMFDASLHVAVSYVSIAGCSVDSVVAVPL